VKPLLTLALVLAALLRSEAQVSTPNPVPASPATAASSTPAKPLYAERQIRKAVVFIKMTCASGREMGQAQGTGFFVAYPDKRLGERGGFSYLVTNRHVAECWDEETRRPRTVQGVDLTLNLQAGHAQTMHFGPGNVAWVLPSDPSVDLAAAPLLPDQRLYDYVTISLADFVADDGVLSEGDKVVLSGFFYQFPGVRRIQPIVREGILAMLPDEELITTTGKPGKVYLADVHIFGGNSGSPVLVNLGGLHGSMISSDSYHMLGVVSGMYYEDTDVKLQVTTTASGTVHANSGIAMIVPASQVKALLEDPRLQSQRDAAVPLILQREAAAAAAAGPSAAKP
jgi:hypothetical protein